jgi:hypothetical protein
MLLHFRAHVEVFLDLVRVFIVILLVFQPLILCSGQFSLAEDSRAIVGLELPYKAEIRIQKSLSVV